MLLKLLPILALCTLTLAHYSADEESVALPGVGLGLVGLKAKADMAKFKAGAGVMKLGLKGAKKAFHAGALLGAANPNEFEENEGFSQMYGAQSVGAEQFGAYGFRSSGAEQFGAYGAEQFDAQQPAYGAYGFQGAHSFKDSQLDSFGADAAYGAYGFQGAQGSSFKDSQLDSFGAESAYGAYGFQGAQGAYGASEFVAQPQEFEAESPEDAQFRFLKKKKKKIIFIKEEGGDDDHHEKHEDKHIHKHQHLHYDKYDVHHHGGGHGYGHGGGYGGHSGGYGHGGGYGGGHGYGHGGGHGYGHGGGHGYGHGGGHGYGHGGGHGYGHGGGHGYGHGGGHGGGYGGGHGYGHGGYGGHKGKRDICGYTQITDATYTTPYEVAVYDLNNYYTTDSENYETEPFFDNEHINTNNKKQQRSTANERTSRCLGLENLLMDMVASPQNIHAHDDDEGVALPRFKRDTRPKRTLAKFLDGLESPDISDIFPDKTKLNKKKTNSHDKLYKTSKTTPDALLPPLSPEHKQQFSSLYEHFDRHGLDSSQTDEHYISKPKTSRQNHSHLRPFKNFQVNLFDTTPFHKRKNALLDDTRHGLGPAGNSHLPVPIQPAQLVTPPPKHSSPSVHDLIDQHATHPVNHFENHHHGSGGKKVGCPCPNGKCELGCECAEPYKQALWNFVQCMQGCIESVLTEIDKIRIADSLNHGSHDNFHSAGKFPRSSSITDRKNLEELRKMVQEYRDKLNELEFVTKDGFHVHSTYLEDSSAQKETNNAKAIVLNEPYPKYRTESSEASVSSSDEDDFSGFTEDQIKSILNRFLHHYVNLEKNYIAYKDRLLANTDQNESESDSSESFEVGDSVTTVHLSELENLRPCDFQSFLKIVFEKLLQQQLTYSQLRELCLNDIKRCIDARSR